MRVKGLLFLSVAREWIGMRWDSQGDLTIFQYSDFGTWNLDVASDIQDHFHSKWHHRCIIQANQNVFTHLESSAAEEEVEDEERSHCEPAKITECLKYVGFIVGVIKSHCEPAEITKCLKYVGFIVGVIKCQPASRNNEMPEQGIVWMSTVYWGLGEFKGRLENLQRRQKITAVDGK